MALGAFAAIGQNNIKRLMAYSSIGNMGYRAGRPRRRHAEGVQGVLVYMAIYMAMTLGAFACILADAPRRRHGREHRRPCRACRGRTRGIAFMLAMLMFSLAGIPPLAGFFAKFYVFLAAIQAGLYALAVIGVLASVVGAYYYLRIVKVMYFDEPRAALRADAARAAGWCSASRGCRRACSGSSPAPLVEAAGAAAKSLF